MNVPGRNPYYGPQSSMYLSGIGVYMLSRDSKMITMMTLACFIFSFCCANNHATCADVIQGLQPKISQTSAQPNQSEPSLEDPCYGRELGIPHRRDPDALPPGNVFEWISNTIYTLLVGLGGGNVVFAIKAGILTVVLSLPSLMKNSAQLAYGTVANIQHMKSESDIHPFREPIRLGYVSSAIQLPLSCLI